MVSNSIHFIDLVNWWTGWRVKDVVSTDLRIGSPVNVLVFMKCSVPLSQTSVMYALELVVA